MGEKCDESLDFFRKALRSPLLRGASPLPVATGIHWRAVFDGKSREVGTCSRRLCHHCRALEANGTNTRLEARSRWVSVGREAWLKPPPTSSGSLSRTRRRSC